MLKNKNLLLYSDSGLIMHNTAKKAKNAWTERLGGSDLHSRKLPAHIDHVDIEPIGGGACAKDLETAVRAHCNDYYDDNFSLMNDNCFTVGLHLMNDVVAASKDAFREELRLRDMTKMPANHSDHNYSSTATMPPNLVQNIKNQAKLTGTLRNNSIITCGMEKQWGLIGWQAAADECVEMYVEANNWVFSPNHVFQQMTTREQDKIHFELTESNQQNMTELIHATIIRLFPSTG